MKNIPASLPLPNATPAGGSASPIAVISPVWVSLAAGAMVIAYVMTTPGHRFGGAVVSALAFALVQWLFPSCRPVATAPLCPWNWALFLFGLQLLVLPFSILVAGPSGGVLPHLPSDDAINAAMLMAAAAFAAFAASYQYLCRKAAMQTQTSRKRATKVVEGDDARSVSARRMAPYYVSLGIAGLFLAFRSPSGLLNYFQDPAKYTELFEQASHTFSGVASLLLRPFLGFGLVMLWCGWMDRKGREASAWRIAAVTLIAMLGVVLSYSTFSYNRGSFVVPVVAMLTVLIARGKRASLGSPGKRASFGVTALAAGVLAAILIFAPFYAVYRNTGLTGDRTAAELLSDPAVTDFFTENIDLMDTLQMYASGPQYMGYLLEESHWGARLYWGATLFPSIVQPIPVLGRSVAESSGPIIYNKMIYGTAAMFDQILPFAGEMFLNFHVVGVIVGFCLLARVAFWLQRGFERSETALETYIWQYSAVWMLFLIMGSISVLTQILLYFYAPIYFYIWFSRRSCGTARGRA